VGYFSPYDCGDGRTHAGKKMGGLEGWPLRDIERCFFTSVLRCDPLLSSELSWPFFRSMRGLTL
jgi:hypothetical protein